MLLLTVHTYSTYVRSATPYTQYLRSTPLNLQLPRDFGKTINLDLTAAARGVTFESPAGRNERERHRCMTQ